MDHDRPAYTPAEAHRILRALCRKPHSVSTLRRRAWRTDEGLRFTLYDITCLADERGGSFEWRLESGDTRVLYPYGKGAGVWIHPGVMSGAPCIENTRIPTRQIGYPREWTWEEVHEGWDYITCAQYEAAIRFEKAARGEA